MGKVLLVEDNSSVRRVLTSLLGTLSHEVKAVSNGREALQQLSEQTFDCVITDLDMPVMNGIALINAIRQSGMTLPIVVLSGTAHSSYHALKEANQAQMYLEKPVTAAKLQETLCCIF